MNEKNLDYLKKTLEYLGFDTKLNDVLETAIKREIPRFTLGISNTHQPLEKGADSPRTDHIRYELNFNKAKESDMYYLNDYKVSLHKQDEAVPRVQTFDLERDHRITALQALKLLSGLSFEKDIYPRQSQQERTEEKPEKTSVWFKLNLEITDAYGNHPLRTFYPEYGYDLKTSLEKFPLKNLNDPAQKEALITSLRYGKMVDAELAVKQKTMPVRIAANPQMKTIDVFDKTGRPLRNEEIFPERGGSKNYSQERVPESEQSWQQEMTVEKNKGRSR